MKKLYIASAFLLISVSYIIYYNAYDNNYKKEYDLSDVERYKDVGLDVNAPTFFPETFGYDQRKIDSVYSYNFDRVNKLLEYYKKADKKNLVRRLFDKITQYSTSDTEKHKKVLEYVQRSFIHSPFWQPMQEDGQMVTDPLILLTLGEGRCGHVARVGADLFESAGYKTRLVQLGGHVISEIYYDAGWHYFDADLFGNGEVVEIDGVIPSVSELQYHTEKLDRLAAYRELTPGGRAKMGSVPYPSGPYFYKKWYGERGPMYYVKNSSESDLNNEKYGWNYLEKIEHDDWRLVDGEPKNQPGGVFINNVEVTKKYARLDWNQSKDRDGDLLGYRVFVSSTSRNWHYEVPPIDAEFISYTKSGWNPDMYERFFKKPPHDIAIYSTEETFIRLERSNEDQFVTIMPFDEYGESIGKELYYMSTEIRIPALSTNGDDDPGV